MKIFLKLFRESFVFALHEISVNKIRTFLSLLGITIGIFSIISVFTIFDSMEISIRQSIQSLGNDVLFVQKWPWSMGGDYPWWKYNQRPEPTLADLREIQKRSQAAEASSFMVSTTKTIKYFDNAIENATIIAVAQDFDRVMTVDIQYGRFISPVEFYSGKPVAVIGSEIATGLFREPEPIGKEFRLFGTNLEVIGVMKEEGNNIFGQSSDEQVIVPINFSRNYMNLLELHTMIMVKARPGVTLNELRDELSGIMRSIRKLKPRAEDDFAINETDIISKGFDDFFRVIGLVGWIIGGFSLLVGGFGIANIMFVSVKERTRIFGIQKSMGARNHFILQQVLFEAVFLSVFGGILGLIIVFLLTIFISSAFSLDIVLTFGNIALGIFVSAFIGFISGLVPAWTASRLDPVEAMRSTF